MASAKMTLVRQYMKQPDKWCETIDPLSLPYKHFKPLEILGYPHAGNDVFHVKGLVDEKETYAFVKVARRKGADIANEVYVLSQLHLNSTPKVIDYCLDETPFIVTE